LPFEVAAEAAWEMLFLKRAIPIWRGFLRKGLEKGEEILSIDSRDLNKSTNMVEIPPQVVGHS